MDADKRAENLQCINWENRDLLEEIANLREERRTFLPVIQAAESLVSFFEECAKEDKLSLEVLASEQEWNLIKAVQEWKESRRRHDELRNKT